MTAARLRVIAACVALLAITAPFSPVFRAQDEPDGPVLLVQTSRGTFGIGTYPKDAPQTVAHIVALVEQGFYDGLRVHRAEPGQLVQFGDPQTRDVTKRAFWGRGPAASSGHPIGVAEIAKDRTNTLGAVAVAHQGNPMLADSQIYVTLSDLPQLDGQYAVFGRVVSGENVPALLRFGDLIERMSVRR
jgi:peptidyl-prolyl cis-trans isomerase B (cyclophilin B)